MDITEAELSWLMGCLFVFLLIIGYPSVLTAIALIREERVLGKLYWHWQVLLEARRRRKR